MFDSESGIYCYENLINGKKYIGQSKMLTIRIRDHERHFKEFEFWFMGQNKSLWKAVKKYGRENFSFYIVQYCEESELDELEVFYIKELGSHKSVHGYNFSWGGKTPMKNVNHSEKTRKKMSKSKKGYKNPFFGKTHSEETKQRISKSRAETKSVWYSTGKDHFNFGRHHSQDAKIKMSNTRSGVGNPLFGKKRKGSLSKYYGVTKDRTRWKAYINYYKQLTIIGWFDHELDAALAYNKYIIDNNLPHPLNIIGDQL